MAAEWTPAEFATLKAMRAMGCNRRQIADALGRPDGGVQTQIAKLVAQGHHVTKTTKGTVQPIAGSGRPWTDAEVAQLLALRAAGKTFRQIAEALDRTTDACERKLVWLRRQENPDDDGQAAVAGDTLHLRLIAEAMQRGEHLPKRRAA